MNLKHCILFIGLLFFSGCTYQTKISDDSYFNTLKLEEDPYYKSIMCPIIINGFQKDVIIDSGGNFDVTLQNKTIQKFALKKLRSKKGYGLDNKIRTVGVYRGKLKIGNFPEKLVDVEEYKLWSVSISDDAECEVSEKSISESIKGSRVKPEYMGLGALKKHNIFLDITNLKMTLFDKKEDYTLHGKWDNVPFKITENGLEIDIIVNGKIKAAVLDTGASVSIFFNDTTTKTKTIKQNISLHNGMPWEQEFYSYDTKIKNFADYIFGIDFFKRFKLFIDFKKNILYFKRIGAKND